MFTTQWAVCFIGIAVAIATGGVWLWARRHRLVTVTPQTNPGLIMPDATPGPPGSMSPAMVGALFDGKLEPRDLFLAMVDLAVLGYLKLRPLTGDDATAYDWAVSRTDRPDAGLADFETTLLATPVNAGKEGPTATLSTIVGDGPEALAKAFDQLRATVARAGWFTDNGVAPQRRSTWAAAGGVLMLLGLVGAAVAMVSGFTSSPLPGLAGALLIVASGVALIMLTRGHSTITAVGDQTKLQVQRYRGWLQDLQAHDIAADSAQALFAANLASALAFGLETPFAAVFDTAVARHRNWGGDLVLATNWLDAEPADLASLVILLDQFLDDAAKFCRRAGIGEDA